MNFGLLSDNPSSPTPIINKRRDIYTKTKNIWWRVDRSWCCWTVSSLSKWVMFSELTACSGLLRSLACDGHFFVRLFPRYENPRKLEARIWRTRCTCRLIQLSRQQYPIRRNTDRPNNNESMSTSITSIRYHLCIRIVVTDAMQMVIIWFQYVVSHNILTCVGLKDKGYGTLLVSTS